MNSFMVDKETICTSCKTKISNLVATTGFKCPKCGEAEIIRCERCRRLGVKYICPSCSFSGPN